MGDIAEIGFKVNTVDLKKAEDALDRVSAAAAGVSSTTTRMESIVEGANASIARASVTAARAENQRATAVLKTMRASGSATAAEIKAAKAIQQKTAAALADAQAEQTRLKGLRDLANANMKVASSARVAAAAQGQLAATNPGTRVSNVSNGGTLGIARDQMPNRFNTGNIAAQFQDIGVTAQMGMSPMVIALQQGTQLSAIINSMESPLKGIGLALRSIFNATSLLTIGIVGLVAAGIQMVDWASVAKSLLYGLADAAEVATPYIIGLAAALATIYSRTIIMGIYAVAAAIVSTGTAALVAGAKMAAAWVIGLGPIAWVVASVAAVATAFQLMGFDILGYVRTAVNGIVGLFVGAFNSVKATWRMLPAVFGDIVISTANLALKNIGDMINEFVRMINSLLDALPDNLKPGKGRITWKADVEINNPFEGAAAGAGAKAAEEFKKAFEKDYVGAGIGIAKNAGKSIAEGLRNVAKGIGQGEDDKKGGKTEQERYEDVIATAERRINTLKAEQAAIGQTELETARLKYTTELLNDAQQKKIDLDKQDIATGMTRRQQLEALGEEMAQTAEKTRYMKESLDLVKDTTSGFISDLRSNLQEGQSLWESFGSAVSNTLNKLIDKILEASIDGLFGGSGLGGLSQGISGIMGLFGGAARAESQVGNLVATSGLFAKGGAFRNGNVVAFANGGVVDGPTSFGMSGGRQGVMGEAGPEAIVPLHKGPDGALGVKMHDTGGGSESSGETGNTYIINAPGASKADLQVVQQTLLALAGPGKIEERVTNAQKRGAV